MNSRIQRAGASVSRPAGFWSPGRSRPAPPPGVGGLPRATHARHRRRTGDCSPGSTASPVPAGLGEDRPGERAAPTGRRSCAGTTTPSPATARHPERSGPAVRAPAHPVRSSATATSGPGTASGAASASPALSTSTTPGPPRGSSTSPTRWSTRRRSGTTPSACAGCATPRRPTGAAGSRSSATPTASPCPPASPAASPGSSASSCGPAVAGPPAPSSPRPPGSARATSTPSAPGSAGQRPWSAPAAWPSGASAPPCR